MHCPNCGTKAASNQKYCRSCGFSLEKFSQVFAEQSLTPESPDLTPEKPDDIQIQRHKVERLRNIILGAFSIGLLGFVLGYGATYRAMIVEGRFLLGALIWLFIIGATAAALLSLWAEKLQQAAAQRKQKQSNMTSENLPAADTTSKLELDGYCEPLSSVTENTTRSLDPAPVVVEKRSGELSR